MIRAFSTAVGTPSPAPDHMAVSYENVTGGSGGLPFFGRSRDLGVKPHEHDAAGHFQPESDS